jgi:CBS domain-containing protein
MNDGATLAGVASSEFVGVTESDTLLGTVRLLAAEDAESAVVMRGREPVGLVRAADVYDALAAEGRVDDVPVREVMSDPPPRLASSQTVAAAADALTGTAHDLLLVVDGEDLLGTVRARDLVEARATASREDAVPPSPATAASPDDVVYSGRSICEVCGSFSEELVQFNGQLVCEDCHTV